MLKILCLILSLTAFLAVIWIIIPAPAYFIWLFSVAASEWSLWLTVFSFSTLLLSLGVAFFGAGGSRIWLVSPVIALAAVLISLYPLFSVLPLANENNVSLSLSEYFGGSKIAKPTGGEFTTHSFAIAGGQSLQLDVYAPRAQNENNGAAVIVIHGGSWNARSRNDFPVWNSWLAENGFTVFDIDYRLAPQPNYLTATADVKCAVLWVKQHAAEFNISPERIALFGRSAGAHLALLSAYSAGDSRLQPSCPANGESENVRAAVSFYAPVELLWAYDHPANEFVIDGPQTLANFLGGNPQDSQEIKDHFILASPTAHISIKSPPTLLVHGGKDQLVREENMHFAGEKLREKGVPHKTIFIPYAQHGFDYNFHGFGSQIVKPLMLDFLIENTR